MGRMSKDKGARGERELAGELQRLFGVAARRGVQFRGGTDSPDVIADIPGIHIECKRCERLSLYPAIKQAVKDAEDKIPVVCHRQNNREWLLIVQLEDLPQLVTVISNKASKTNIENTNKRKEKSL